MSYPPSPVINLQLQNAPINELAGQFPEQPFPWMPLQPPPRVLEETMPSANGPPIISVGTPGWPGPFLMTAPTGVTATVPAVPLISIGAPDRHMVPPLVLPAAPSARGDVVLAAPGGGIGWRTRLGPLDAAGIAEEIIALRSELGGLVGAPVSAGTGTPPGAVEVDNLLQRIEDLKEQNKFLWRHQDSLLHSARQEREWAVKIQALQQTETRLVNLEQDLQISEEAHRGSEDKWRTAVEGSLQSTVMKPLAYLHAQVQAQLGGLRQWGEAMEQEIRSKAQANEEERTWQQKVQSAREMQIHAESFEDQFIMLREKEKLLEMQQIEHQRLRKEDQYLRVREQELTKQANEDAALRSARQVEVFEETLASEMRSLHDEQVELRHQREHHSNMLIELAQQRGVLELEQAQAFQVADEARQRMERAEEEGRFYELEEFRLQQHGALARQEEVGILEARCEMLERKWADKFAEVELDMQRRELAWEEELRRLNGLLAALERSRGQHIESSQARGDQIHSLAQQVQKLEEEKITLQQARRADLLRLAGQSPTRTKIQLDSLGIPDKDTSEPMAATGFQSSVSSYMGVSFATSYVDEAAPARDTAPPRVLASADPIQQEPDLPRFDLPPGHSGHLVDNRSRSASPDPHRRHKSLPARAFSGQEAEMPTNATNSSTAIGQVAEPRDWQRFDYYTAKAPHAPQRKTMPGTLQMTGERTISSSSDADAEEAPTNPIGHWPPRHTMPPKASSNSGNASGEPSFPRGWYSSENLHPATQPPKARKTVGHVAFNDNAEVQQYEEASRHSSVSSVFNSPHQRKVGAKSLPLTSYTKSYSQGENNDFEARRGAAPQSVDDIKWENNKDQQRKTMPNFAVNDVLDSEVDSYCQSPELYSQSEFYGAPALSSGVANTKSGFQSSPNRRHKSMPAFGFPRSPANSPPVASNAELTSPGRHTAALKPVEEVASVQTNLAHQRQTTPAFTFPSSPTTEQGTNYDSRHFASLKPVEMNTATVQKSMAQQRKTSPPSYFHDQLQSQETQEAYYDAYDEMHFMAPSSQPSDGQRQEPMPLSYRDGYDETHLMAKSSQPSVGRLHKSMPASYNTADAAMQRRTMPPMKPIWSNEAADPATVNALSAVDQLLEHHGYNATDNESEQTEQRTPIMEDRLMRDHHSPTHDNQFATSQQSSSGVVVTGLKDYVTAGWGEQASELEDLLWGMDVPPVYTEALRIVNRYGWEALHGGDNAWTVLHWAASEGHMNICAWLLQKGADLAHVDENGQTPVDCAEARGHRGVVDLFAHPERSMVLAQSPHSVSQIVQDLGPPYWTPGPEDPPPHEPPGLPPVFSPIPEGASSSREGSPEWQSTFAQDFFATLKRLEHRLDDSERVAKDMARDHGRRAACERRHLEVLC